jgi:hypothetical protein
VRRKQINDRKCCDKEKLNSEEVGKRKCVRWEEELIGSL